MDSRKRKGGTLVNKNNRLSENTNIKQTEPVEPVNVDFVRNVKRKIESDKENEKKQELQKQVNILTININQELSTKGSAAVPLPTFNGHINSQVYEATKKKFEDAQFVVTMLYVNRFNAQSKVPTIRVEPKQLPQRGAASTATHSLAYLDPD